MDTVVGLIVVGTIALLLAAFALHALCARIWARANGRADMLVREFLTPDELGQLQLYGFLTVPSGSTPGRVYRIPAWPGFVTVVDAGKPVIRLCLQPACSVPEREHVLVHKLLLEGAEREYWQRANHHVIGELWRVADDARVEVWMGAAPGVLSQR
jgi:hypothetical protein